MSICGLRRLSIHYTPHPRAVLPLCFSAFAATYTTPEGSGTFIHASMGSMSSMLATVSTALRRAQHEPRRRRSPYRPRRSRLFPVRVTYLFFRSHRSDPSRLFHPPHRARSHEPPPPKGRRHRPRVPSFSQYHPRFPLPFSQFIGLFFKLFYDLFFVPSVTRSSNGRAQQKKARPSGVLFALCFFTICVVCVRRAPWATGARERTRHSFERVSPILPSTNSAPATARAGKPLLMTTSSSPRKKSTSPAAG